MFSTGHKMLQRARSLRRVHHDEQSAHKRQTSASSDASRASSSGSDTSSSSRENTPEWDPLRLHPSMEVDRSPHITPVYHENRHHHSHNPHHHQHHHQHQHEGSRHPQIVDHQAEYHPPRHTQQEARVQVYGGFDFGFEKPQPLSPADSDAGRHRLRAPKSETDLHRRHDAAMAGGGGGADWHGLPSPVRRTRPAGYDEADFFIKRGGWKRRGIVFGSSEPTHDAEDNCFDVI